MEHKDIYEQTHKKTKTATTAFISLALAGALLVGATKVASNIKLKKDNDITNTSPETTMVTPESSELVLTDDFDINNPEEVSKRAEDIYNLSEKKCSVLDIKNSIYIINEMYDKISYPEGISTDDEKFKYINQQLAVLFGITLDDYLYDYVVTMDQILNENISDPIFVGTTNPVPCAYMWMPATDETKNFAIEIAKVYYEQRANIRNNNKAAMTITANEYYNLYIKAKTLNLPTGEKVILFKQFRSINPLFTPLLSKEQAEDLDNALGFITTATNKLFSAASENLDVSPLLKESLESGTCGEELTKLEDKYRAQDLSKAEERVEKSNELIKDETKVVNPGGNPASGSNGKQEVINGNVTTSVSESEFVVEIPNEGVSEVTESGGKVVEENTTIQSTTTKPAEETTTYVDDEDIPVMDDKEFFGNATDEDIENYKNNSVQKLGFGLLGTGSLGVVFSKKKRK